MITKSQFSGIPSNKRSRITHQHDELDRISDLPDWAISHILSRLPTKDAVRTSVLSTDWEYKWTSIHHIVFDDDGKTCENESKKATFVNFVDRALLQLQNLQSLCIFCIQKYDLSRMKAWISAALSRNVQYLSIYYDTASFVLPRNLLHCYSLRKLVVISHCILNVPAPICLPHLTTLCLKNIEILNEDSSTDVLKFNFPVMEKFELLEHKWLNVKFVEIYAPKMTSFKYKTYDAGVNEYCSIKITGDSLVKFEYSGGFAENIVLYGSAVTDATLNFNLFESEDPCLLEKNGLQIRKLLKSFSSLKDLELSGGTMENALLQSKLGLSLPRYYRMERLVLISFGNSEVLLELLHAAPSLKFLVIDVLRCNAYDYDAEEYVPSCVVSHLEEVRFIWFCGLTHEFKLVKFFLKNALKLKSLRVKCSPLLPKKKRDEIEKELCTYPRASPYLTIVVPHKQ